MSDVNFYHELQEFINNHENDKIHNSAVKQDIYNKILDRKVNNKRTNVKAITNVTKLCQYYLAAIIVGDWGLQRNIEEIIYEAGNYINASGYEWSKKFKAIFSEVEFELPERRVLKAPKVEYIDDKFYIYDGNDKFEAEYDSTVTYNLLPIGINIRLNGNCWGSCEYTREATAGSIVTSMPWNITAKVTYDKVNNKYLLSDVVFYSTYDLQGLELVARYTGLHNSAWVTSYTFGYGSSECVANTEWQEHHEEVKRGKVYIFKGSHSIASITGDWDGNYNNLSFDKFKKLLEQL